VPRRLRIFVPGGIYHVYCRVARGERVFAHQSEVDRWIDAVAFVSRLHNLSILAWCLMSNHYHLVVRTGTMPLWRAMARLQGRVAIDHNRRRRVVGRLWQSRYKARLVNEAEHLRHVIAYVHLNPVAAGMVGDPLDHPASGHGELLGVLEPHLCDVAAALLSYDEVLETARIVYQQWLRAVAEARWLQSGVRDLPWWRTVKDDDETVPRDQAPDSSLDYAGQPLAPENHRRPPLELILRTFEIEVGLAKGQLTGRARTRYLSWCRCLFVTFAVSWLGFPAKEVAQLLDKASGSVSRWLSEGLELQQTEPSFRSTLDLLAGPYNLEPADLGEGRHPPISRSTL
jgi:REP element-mobilizing transposase RayT